MNIAIIAPTKFDFQDLACVELGLRWPEVGTPSLRAEPENGEDAELIWEEDGKRRLCEVQVKGRSTAEIDMATLAEYLAHFPDSQAEGCLLERLITDPDQVVLFVASERCRDEVAEFLVPTTWTGTRRTAPPHSRVGKSLAEALKYLSEWPKRARTKVPTPLEFNRVTKLSELANVSSDRLAKALSQVFIHENETPASIGVRLHQKLFDHGVPTDRLSDGISRLKQVIADDRLGRPDVFNSLRVVLADFAPEPQAQPKYLRRGNEEDFAAELARKKAILFSGPPRVGKSWLAHQLAGGLQQQGFEVASSSHIDQADRFLNDPIRRPRAYVLEDPLGDRQSHLEAMTRVSELRRLLSSLPTDRRLIVTQSDAPILQTFRQSRLQDCAIGQFSWRILGPLTVDQAENLWRRDAMDAVVAQEEIERVVGIIHTRADLRDAGALAYLAITFDKLRIGATIDEIVAQARSDAVDFAQMLADQSTEVGDVLRGVAVSTETTMGVNEADLAFVLSGGDVRPSVDRLGGVLVYGQHDATKAPTYSVEVPLTQVLKDASIVLRRRRILDSQCAQLSFVHPYWRAGAQAIFRPDLDEDVAEAVAISERALSAVDQKVSLAAARNLDWIASALTTHVSGLSKAVDLAETGLCSLYPATRDACFAFLTSRAADLQPEQLKHLRRWISAVDLEFDQIEEVDGVLLVSKTSIILRYKPVSIATVQPYLNAIENDQPLDLDPALTYAILLALRQTDTDLTPKMMDRLLSMDAAVLRAAAIKKWLEIGRIGDEDIVRRIKNDVTPSISNAVLATLARSWDSFSEARREVLLSILEAHAEAPGSAIILMERLSMFNRVEEFGETPPWQVFSRLAVIAFEHAPDVVFRNGRIVSVVKDAIKAGEGERLMPLLTAWARHLIECLKTRLPDEFELSIPDAMIDVGPSSWRWPLIEGILHVQNTGARLRTIATLISRWKDLSDDEQQAIIQFISQNDADSDWLRAAALTRRNVPEDVLIALTGRADLLDLSPTELLIELGEPLYSACLHVFIGAPQPLWWLGSHHVQTTAWIAAVQWSAGAPNRPCFKFALDDRLSFAKDDDWLVELVNQYEVDELSTVFAVFLSRKIGDNGNWLTPAWNCLLDRGVQTRPIDDWFMQISEAAPVFLDHLRDVRHWLGEGAHEDRLLESLGADVSAYRLAKTTAELVDSLSQIDSAAIEEFAKDGAAHHQSKEQLISGLLEVVRRALDQEPPRLVGTWDDVAKTLRNLDVVAPTTLEWIEKRRRQLLENRRGIHLLEMNMEDQSVLVGWIGPR